MKFDNVELVKALNEAGWSQDRQIDISAWTSAMSAAGFVMHGPATAILSSLGGLRIPPRGGVVCETEELVFDPFVIGTFGGRRFRLEEFLGTALSPIGEYGHSCELFADEVGRLIGLWNSASIFSWGDSLEDSLCRMIFGTQLPTRTRLPAEVGFSPSSIMGKFSTDAGSGN